jgi:cytidine deaminase
MNLNKVKMIIPRLSSKADSSPSKFKIAAVAFTKQGNLLGFESNGFRDDITANKVSRYGAGKHAERALMVKFGKKIDTIYLFRVGSSGNALPIEPCESCKKTADKLGIKIISLVEYVNN